MQAQLQTEAEQDGELYDKLVCWCQTNDKEKTKAIADGQQKSAQLAAAIEEAKALASTRETEIGQLTADVASLEKALTEAAAIREKENAEFTVNEKDLTASITSLAGAVTQLGKAHGGASLLLKQMKETFETNLESGKQEENKSVSDYQNLKSTKETQVKGAKDKIFTKTEELAKAKEAAVVAKSDLGLTEKTVAADTEFLAKLREQCTTIDKQWEERSKMRNEEIAAVGETIGILTDDAARDQFTSAGQFL